MQAKISAFVITYNRASLLESCLRAAAFADELIVVDKSSTDNSVAVAAQYADRVEVVPWSPTVEETRAFALSLCRHEWVLFLDDDEILSPETGQYLRDNLAAPDAEIYALPYRHYILGVHDERAYYWPETRHCFFRKGAIEFIPTVHGGVMLQSDHIASIPEDSGVCIHHLSYGDVASWIERTNRYTGRPDRIRALSGQGNLIRFAHDQIDFWMHRTDDPSFNDYPTAVALLRAIYDMVDRLKAWETERDLDGLALFRNVQNNLCPGVHAQEPGTAISGHEERGHWEPGDRLTYRPEGTQLRPAGELTGKAGIQSSVTDERHNEMQAMLVSLRSTESQLRHWIEAERKSSVSLTNIRNELEETIATLVGTRNDLYETHAMLDQTRAKLDQQRATLDETRTALDQTQATLNRTRATLDETRETLDETRVTLDQTRADLTNVTRESEQLSGSARLFIRQYLPKLRSYMSRSLR